MSSVTGNAQMDHCDPDSMKQVCSLCLLQSFPFHSFIMSLIALITHYRFRIRRLVTLLTATVWAWTTCDCIPPFSLWEQHRFQTHPSATRLGFHTPHPARVQTVLHSASSAPLTAYLWTCWTITSCWSLSFKKLRRLQLPVVLPLNCTEK